MYNHGLTGALILLEKLDFHSCSVRKEHHFFCEMHLFACCIMHVTTLSRLGAAGRAAGNGLTDFTGPGNESFNAIVTVSNDTKTGFKGLKENPNT